MIVTVYLEISLGLLLAVWGQFSFRQFLVPGCTSSQHLQAPSNAQSLTTVMTVVTVVSTYYYLVNVNYRVVICCICHFQSSSLYFFGFLCLQFSSVSNLCPDTRGERGHLFKLTCSIVLWGGKNTANKYHWLVWEMLTVSGPHWVSPAHGLCGLPWWLRW